MQQYNKILIYLFVAIISCLWVGDAYAQTEREAYSERDIEVRSFHETEWAKVTKGLDYMGEPEKKEADVNNKENTENGSQYQRGNGNGNSGGGYYNNRRRGSMFSGEGLAQILKFIFFGIAIVILVALMLKIMGISIIGGEGRKIKTNGTQGFSLAELENNIHESDLEKALRIALDGSSYKLAIRIYYLSIIKKLSAKKYIQWKRDKTNREYLREMRRHNEYPLFREVTSMFERVWYGDVELKEGDFTNISPKFEDFIKKI